MSAPQPTSATLRTPGLPAALTHILDQVMRRHLLLNLAEFPVFLAAAIAVAWVAQATADRAFDLSWNARCVLLAIDFLGVWWLFARFAVRPWRHRLDREGAALLVERCMPEFRSSLISAVELAAPTADPLPQSRPLVERLVADVTAHAARADVVAHVIRPQRLKKLLVRWSAPVAAALVLLAACQPTSGLLLKRILLSRIVFPAKTTVVDVTGNLQVDAGGEASLTARAAGEVPADGRLVISRPGLPPEVIPVMPATAGAAEFTRIVKNIRADFSYHFELNDGTGPQHQVTVRFPPAVTTMRFVVVPPAYTKLPETELSPTALKLLEGSTLRIEGTASKDLRAGQVVIQGRDNPLELTVGAADRKHFMAAIPVPGSGWRSLAVHLIGSAGDGSVGDPEYPVELLRDRTPTVTITQPKDETVTVIANDSVPIEFEANDDFELTSATLFYRVFRLLPDGGTEAADTGKIPLHVPPGSRSWQHRFSWNLALLVPPVLTGYKIILWIEATDNNGIAPATGRSAERTIRVISEQEKRLELLELLGRKAAEIEQLYQQQRAINSHTEGTAP
ncbi:MAG: hypothetical protein NTW21_33415 [Verrucomicrobia bacterium]|nr:hypothetical protein [Verrucomicrobiota bacterium]